MAQITFEDKVALNENPSVAAINKVRDVDMNEIKEVINDNETKILLAVTSTAPATCDTGDMYYNTTSKKIFTATATDTWSSTGEDPTENTIYIEFTNQTAYAWNGTDLVSVGGGAGGGGETLPIGTILEFPSTDAAKLPDGYLFCDGSAVSRTTYAQLFAVIGTAWGSGDGSTTFNLPTKEGLVSVGIKSSDTDFDTIGETGGEKTHTLTIDEIPSHNHGIPFQQNAGSGSTNWGITDPATMTGQVGSLNKGGGQAHNNLQPYTVTNYIIKATQTTPVQAEVVNTYSTSQDNTYSCDYVNDAITDTYSTTETLTNKVWIDGSSIYRIVLEGTTSSSSDQVELSAISAINYCVEIRGILYDNGYYLMIPSTGGTSSNYINCAVTSAKKPYIAYSSNYRNKDFKLIIEYTKASS